MKEDRQPPVPLGEPLPRDYEEVGDAELLDLESARESWRRHAPPEARDLLHSAAEDYLQAYPVSTWVNSPSHDTPECLAHA